MLYTIFIPNCSGNDFLETRVVQKPWVPKKERLKDFDELTSIKQLPESSPTTTPPPFQDKPANQSEQKTPTLINHSTEYDNVLLDSIRAIELEFWSREHETLPRPGIVTLALEYIYNEVYRSS